MKKCLGVLFLVVAVAIVLMLPIHKASAATFNPSDVIDDSIFDNYSAMSALQINNFLNSFPNSCISPNSGFEAIDPTGYSPSAGFSYGNFTTAGQVIYDASSVYGINPEVLLVTLEKEQSLVDGGGGSVCNQSGTQNEYAAATGYGCPDSGGTYSYSNVNLYERFGVMVTSTGPTCVDAAAKAGFSQQVILTAWLLKFGEQRSQGNINWAVISGNWDNSDDPQSCYGGPMTQGTFQICPGEPTTYYDGYTTIDGTSTYLDDGATAALYWYTPHFSGNESFDTIFDEWFGSTSYPEPLGSLLAVDNETGQIYFISLTNNTYYAISSWDTLVAYGLNGYPIIPMENSAIMGYSDGGVLQTLVYDSTNETIYLVDHGTRYAFSQYCTQWGLNCLGTVPGSVSNLDNAYFDQDMINGGSNQPVMQVNGEFFLMNNGTREPFATIADLQAAGYSTTECIPIIQTDLNETQPLGPLQISLPNFISLNGSNTIMFFDGQNYHQVPNLATFQAWGSPYPLIPPASTTDTNLPTSTSTLSIWVKDSNNNYYLIDGGRKVNITSNPSDWYTGSFESLPASALTSLTTVPAQTNISSGGNIYQLQSNALRYVPTPNDYYGLGVTPSTTISLTANSIAAIPTGVDVLSDGAPYTVSGVNALYITNDNTSLYVSSVSMANDFGLWGNVRSNLSSNVLSTGYPLAGTLTRWVKSGSGGLTYITEGNVVQINSTAASEWGINTSTQPATSLDPAALSKVTGSQTLGQFVRDVDNGGMYYGTGGASHYIAAYSAFVNLGGTTANIINVSSDFLSAMPAGYTYGW